MQEIEAKAYLANGTAAGGRGSGRVGVRAEGPAGRPQVLRPVRKLAAHDAARERVRHVGVHETASASTARRSAAGRGSPRATCCSCRTRRPRCSTPSPRRPPSRSSARSPTRRRARPTARDPRRSPDGRRRICGETGIADTANFGPECEFFVFDEVSYELVAAPVALRRRLGRGALELGDARASATPCARRAATSRRRRTTRCTTCAPRSC